MVCDFGQIHTDQRQAAAFGQVQCERAKYIVVGFVGQDTVSDIGEIVCLCNQSGASGVSLSGERVYGVDSGESQGLEKNRDFA